MGGLTRDVAPELDAVITVARGHGVRVAGAERPGARRSARGADARLAVLRRGAAAQRLEERDELRDVP